MIHHPSEPRPFLEDQSSTMIEPKSNCASGKTNESIHFVVQGRSLGMETQNYYERQFILEDENSSYL